MAVSKSSYCNSLGQEATRKYLEKLNLLGIEDPYTYAKSDCIKDNPALWPRIEYPDIYNYLVSTPSRYTKEDLKAYKSLDAYKYVVNGWVGDLSLYYPKMREGCSQICIVLGLVRHSQRIAAAKLHPWVAVKPDGIVVSGHCTCMAGLGEVCSHVTALLFAMEVNNKVIQNTSCTSLPCMWLPAMQKVEYAPIKDIDFMTPAKKKAKLVDTLQPMTSSSAVTTEALSNSTTVAHSKARENTIPYPSPNELASFYEELAKTSKAVILSITPQYAKEFAPSGSSDALPKPLRTSLYDSANLNLSYPDLLRRSTQAFHRITISFEQADNLEKATTSQAKSALWFQHRAGRVTASNFKAAAHTSTTKPSLSLIKRICYPESYRFSTAATKWGCTHEATARSEYQTYMLANHEGFHLSETGLIVSPTLPYLGASPDGVIQCNCHGLGTVEIKCPFSCRNESFQEASNKPSFFLECDDSSGKFTLKRTHQYFYQSQAQMKISQVSYSDFITWNEKELVVIRIERDDEFIENVIERVTSFFTRAVLPELLGRWFTRAEKSTSDSESIDTHEVTEEWCFCKGVDEERMILCHNVNCETQWYHLACLQLEDVPSDEWFCPTCADD